MTHAATVMERLQRWYLDRCDGDWEHPFGITIETLDNPGWMVTIDLQDTEWQGLCEAREVVKRSDTDWIETELIDGKFVGAGGAANLNELLELFLRKVT
jgi:hypothetical protein